VIRDSSDADEDELPEDIPTEIKSVGPVLLTFQTEEPDQLHASLHSLLLEYKEQILELSLFVSLHLNIYFVLLRFREHKSTEEFINIRTGRTTSAFKSFLATGEINQELFQSFFDQVSPISISSIFCVRLIFISCFRIRSFFVRRFYLPEWKILVKYLPQQIQICCSQV
jgi:hypothetical protein